MPAFIKSLTFDTSDALETATFWAAALGSDVDEDSTTDKTAKNRLHLDLRAPGAVLDEVRWLEALGAIALTLGTDLVVMLDPDGNEFCVE